jgi:ABC-type dipeptide/oligopeptide/nickel transport system ATPase component
MASQGAMNAFETPSRAIGRADRRADGASTWNGHGQGARPARVRELLETVGIQPERAKSYPHELSGGCGSAPRSRWRSPANPRILLADEPTTALDVMVQAQILQLLTYLSDELGLALVFVTHDLPIVRPDVHARAAVMYAGKIVEQGRPTLSTTRPASLHAAPLGGDSRSRVARRRGVDSRRSASTRRRAPRLSVRSALRSSRGTLHVGAPELRTVGDGHTRAPATLSRARWRS